MTEEAQVPNTLLGIDKDFAGYIPEAALKETLEGVFKLHEGRDRKWRRHWKLKYGKFKVDVPAEFRALQQHEIQVPYPMNAVNSYVDGIMDGDYRFRTPPRNNDDESRERATQQERWIGAAMHIMESNAPKGFVVRPACDDLLSYGQAAQKAMLALDNWNAIPTAKSKYKKRTEKLGPVQKKRLKKAREEYKARPETFPMAWQHVSMRNFYPLYTDRLAMGIERYWAAEHDIMKKYDVRISSRTKGDKARGRQTDAAQITVGPFGPPSAAQDGERQGASFKATSADTAPAAWDWEGGRTGGDSREREVWECADEWCWYVFVTGKLVARWEHGYGFNPYDHVYARPTSDGEGADESISVLRNLDGLSQALDRHLTIKEISSLKNVGQYHVLAATDPTAKPPLTGDGRQPRPVQLVHGEMPYLQPGYEPRKVSEQTSPDNLQTLLLLGELTREQGVNPAAVGGGDAGSGYERRQISNAFAISRGPFAKALALLTQRQAVKFLKLYENHIGDPIELFVGGGRRSTSNQAFYELKPKSVDGWYYIVCLLEPKDASLDVGRMEMGLRMWQGTGGKRGLSHERVLEDFWGYENPEELTDEVAAEEWLDTPAVKAVVNKTAADESGVAKLYIQALEDTKPPPQGLMPGADDIPMGGGMGMPPPVPGGDMGMQSPGPGIEQPLVQSSETGIEPATGEPSAGV
jgi:hypothetical protein